MRFFLICILTLNSLCAFGSNPCESHLRSQVESWITRELYFDDPEFYEWLSENPAYTKQLLRRWYGEHADKLIKTVEREVGSAFVVLLADPGIATRLEAFLIFKKRVEFRFGRRPFDLRQEFASHLGQTTVYRGLILTHLQMVRILEKGLKPYASEFPDEYPQVLHHHFKPVVSGDELFPTSPRLEIFSRIRTQTPDYKVHLESWMSVSHYPEVATSVGYHWSPHQGRANYFLYLFELRVPELSLIRLGNFLDPVALGSKTRISIGENFEVGFRDPLVEQFIPLFVNPNHIVSVRKILEIPKDVKQVFE